MNDDFEERKPLMKSTSTISIAERMETPPPPYTTLVHSVSVSSSSSQDTYDESTASDQRKKQLSSSTESIVPISSTATLMHLMKGNMGTGLLAMPIAFANSGLLVGTLFLPIIGIFSIHCMHILIKSSVKVCEHFGVAHLDYHHTAEKAFKLGPLCLRSQARNVSRVVKMFLLVTQMGFCCVYSLFVAENLREFIKNITNKHFDIDLHLILLLMLPLMIVLNLIRRLKHLAIVSTIANVLQFTGVALIFFGLFDHIPSVKTRPLYADLSKLPIYFSISVYAFEGIGLVLPLKKDMNEPTAFGGHCGVLNTGMVIVSCIYLGMGFFGFLKYGDKVKGSITLSLPSTPVYEMVQLMFAISIFLSFALQLYVPINIIWPYLLKKLNLEANAFKTKAIDYCLRAGLVSFTFLLAGAIPMLDLFISLVGAVSSSCLALIFPPIIEIAVYWNDNSIGRKGWIILILKDLTIILFGLMIFVTGTYTSLIQIARTFQRT